MNKLFFFYFLTQKQPIYLCIQLKMPHIGRYVTL